MPATKAWGDDCRRVVEGQRLSSRMWVTARAYLLRAGTLDQLTADHSLVAEKVRIGILTPQEADASEMQSVLTRAVGTHENVEVDADETNVACRRRAVALLDGLSRMVTDPEIASTILTSTFGTERGGPARRSGQ